jgi:hypothetical protein
MIDGTLFLETLTAIGYPAMIRHGFVKNCCLPATRVTIEVLNYFGISAKPQPVSVLIYNKKFVDAVMSAGGKPDMEAILNSDPEHWSLGLGMPELKHKLVGPKGYDYHMVAIADGVMIDLTLPQANRPQYNIVLPSVYFHTEGKKQFSFEANGCMIVYTLREDSTFTTLRAWRDEEYKVVAGELIRELKKKPLQIEPKKETL